jgi:site-specific recombinase XerD
LELADAIQDWHLALRASNLAPRTISSYVDAAERLAGFVGSGAEVHQLTHRDIQRFLVHLAETPHQRTGRPVTASYVAGIYRRLQQLFRWLEEEGEIPSSPFRRLRPPAVPTRPVPVLTDGEIRRLLSTRDRRSQALLRVLLDTGVRVSELVSMRRDNPRLVQGKGRRPRTVFWSHTTELAVRRYLRTRSDDHEAVWVGRAGPLTASGVRQVVRDEGRRAGIDGLHPHRLRHTFAHRWLLAGGSPEDLMTLAGWSSREMLTRYGAAGRQVRAEEAYRRVHLGLPS